MRSPSQSTTNHACHCPADQQVRCPSGGPIRLPQELQNQINRHLPSDQLQLFWACVYVLIALDNPPAEVRDQPFTFRPDSDSSDCIDADATRTATRLDKRIASGEPFNSDRKPFFV